MSDELAPTHEVPDDRMGVKQAENDGTENKQEQSQHTSESKNANIELTQHIQNQKPSMVAEPIIKYSEIYSKGKSKPNTFKKYYKI